MHQKLLTGFTPKALLPAKSYPIISPKQRVLMIIDLLESEGALTDYNSRLLEAIAISPLWDEETYKKFENLGLSLAKEQFDLAFINSEYEETLASPENPKNWKK
ncbi:hypothetical protein [Trichormus variabilis]|uniref:Uncharacterized protein n=1 Tax=Trichormus variabilis SAG 1403-4b TaxID=447716 RepID=A0A433UGF8_ANAVA|nr:hypothetical protein [Trichormus variabilis]MBD2629667.1 hypothetical protein [Trichormus variabilis FACHB-164]RUS92915.1 hypothetical protein DSM107003_46620 [Trichormus variabilis SAG 1403-4b]